jgi:choline kinase
MTNYKVCILTAGVGGRMGGLSDHINKAILPVNFKAVLSHIIEKFPEEAEIVIAVGHKKETVKDYLAISHPERKITVVEIDKYVGPGTGPGYSLLQCREHLNCPFIFVAADTLVIEKIPEPTENWFGIAPVKETEKYCTVKIKNNLIYQLDDKIKTDNRFAFIGLAGIRDYETFFDALEKDKKLKSGEIQVSNGFSNLIEKKLIPTAFTWFDTGTLENYRETNQSFSGGNVKFDFSKNNEFIYFVNGKVIKYFSDEEIVNKRVNRAKLLKGLVPEIESRKGSFYSYKRISGQILYNMLNRRIIKNFFQWLKQNLWRKKEMSNEFVEACRKFYYDKTVDRLRKFYQKTGIEDTPTEINGVQIPSLNDLLKKIDWDYLTGIPNRISWGLTI